MSTGKFNLILLMTLVLLCACASPQSQAASVEDARAALLHAIAAYTPGAPVTDEITASIDAAATALEEAAGQPPKLAEMKDILTGQWASLFSSQGIVGEIDMAFMTRAHPGGGVSGGKALSHMVLQELNPDQGFYRNLMVMSAGEDQTPLLHLATAELALAEDQPNVLLVRFKRIEFVPASAEVGLSKLRSVLGLPEDAHLAINIPYDENRPASMSSVTYLDEDLRINRGKNYIAVLRKVQ